MEGFHTLPDGKRLYYQRDDFTNPWTKAPTILLVHGYGETSAAWWG